MVALHTYRAEIAGPSSAVTCRVALGGIRDLDVHIVRLPRRQRAIIPSRGWHLPRHEDLFGIDVGVQAVLCGRTEVAAGRANRHSQVRPTKRSAMREKPDLVRRKTGGRHVDLGRDIFGLVEVPEKYRRLVAREWTDRAVRRRAAPDVCELGDIGVRSTR